jgi:hypothetical protein
MPLSDTGSSGANSTSSQQHYQPLSQQISDFTDYSRVIAASASKQIPTLTTLHPCAGASCGAQSASTSWVAYVKQDTITHQQTSIVVQHTVSGQVLYQLCLLELARHTSQVVKGSTLASSALGTVLSLAFYDPSTLYWSGMYQQKPPLIAVNLMPSSNASNGATTATPTIPIDSAPSVAAAELQLPLPRNQYLLCVHTTNRIWILDLHQQSLPGTAVAHLCHQTLSANANHKNESGGTVTSPILPTSNAFPLSPTCVLVGCTDGSLKCYEWFCPPTSASSTCVGVTKSIKGLGKNDWIVSILSSYPYDYSSSETASAGSDVLRPVKRRIITVTRKEIAYWMDIDVSLQYVATPNGNDTGGTATISLRQHLEIHPPVARFVLGSEFSLDGPTGSAHSNSHSPAATPQIRYDGHRNFLFWTVPQRGVILGWDLDPLPAIIARHAGGSAIGSNSVSSGVGGGDGQASSSLPMFKPDPTVIIQIPPLVEGLGGTSGNVADGTLGATITAFSGSSESTICHQNIVIPLLTPSAFSQDTLVVAVAHVSVDASSAVALHAMNPDEIQLWVATVSDTISFSGPNSGTGVGVGSTVSGSSAIGGAKSRQIISAELVTGLSLGQLLHECVSDEFEQFLPEPPLVRLVHSAGTSSSTGSVIVDAPLGAPSVYTVATHIGVIVIDWPVQAARRSLYTTLGGGMRHVHFGAGLGSLGKSVLFVDEFSMCYASVDVIKPNPIGRISAKNVTVVHECNPDSHLPVGWKKRLFKLTPTLFLSPSGTFLAVLWTTEARYEVYNVAGLMARVGQARQAGIPGRTPLVASGIDVVDFAWVGDEDAYAILHADDNYFSQSRAGLLHLDPVFTEKTAAAVASAVAAPTTTLGVAASMLDGTLGQIGTGAGLAKLKDLGEHVTSISMNATKAAASSTKSVRSTMKSGVSKVSFGLFGKKKKGKGTASEEVGLTITEDDTSDIQSISQGLPLPLPAIEPTETGTIFSESSEKSKRSFVELRCIVSSEAQPADIGDGVTSSSSTSLGEIPLRGGNRQPPAALFSGPVLCVATREEDGSKGQAHFYTSKKTGTENDRGSTYVTAGPTLPFPDLVVWDDDGVLVAVVLETRVAVYSSDNQQFVLLGTVRLGTTFDQGSGKITNAKFVHGTLYCCTSNSVHCIFLGSRDSEVCVLDTFLLATSNIAFAPSRSGGSSDCIPPVTPLPLVMPIILGYQGGSLLVSSLRGVFAVPLAHPLARVGSLLAANQVDTAVKWFEAIPSTDHETLASFLERQGRPELALSLSGLSLETYLDLTMRHGLIAQLEELVEDIGVRGLRMIDMGRGTARGLYVHAAAFGENSLVVCVGAYLLAHGRIEFVRRLASECLRLGEDGKRDTLALGSLMLSVDADDARRLLGRAVEDADGADWPVAAFVRDHVLSQSS